MSLPIIVATGFAMGVRHAADPVHITAVTTVVARHRSAKATALIGALWGIGFGATVVLVGSRMILAGEAPSARVAPLVQLAAGVLLIALGVSNLGFGSSANDGSRGHSLPATQEPLAAFMRRVGLPPLDVFAPVAAGVVQGLAEATGVVVIALTDIKTLNWSIVHLTLFALGAIVGMTAITTAIALAVRVAAQSRLIAAFRVMSGLVSVTLGCMLVYRLFITGALHLPFL